MRKNWYSVLICAVSTVVLFCTLGLATSTISIYLPYIISGGGLTSTQGSFLLSLRSLSSLVTIVAVVERLYRRVKLRWGIVCALILDTIAFSTYGMADAYIQYCAAAILAGIAYGIGGIIPVSVLIGRWYKTNRSFAIGICTAGSGVATIVVPPAFVALAENLSVQDAFLSMARVIALTTVLAAAVLRDDPETADWEPFCSKKAEKTVCKNCSPVNQDTVDRGVVLLGVMLLGAASHSASQNALLDLTAVVVLNCGMPLTTVGTAMIAYDMSTDKGYARMMRDCQSATMIGAVIFTTVPGMISDLTGSYVPAYMLLLLIGLLATLIIQYSYYRKECILKSAPV